MGKGKKKELGDFLRKCREKIKPAQVGLPGGKRRRTSGLRREEVALLSGIGVTWYTWLEQGKEINISVDILESLARTFMLNENEKRYMYLLAERIPEEKSFISTESIAPALQNVLDNLLLCPSFILDRRWNVVAWNKASEVVFGDFNSILENKRNLVWMMFNDNNYRKVFSDWDSTAKGMISRFRLTSDKYIEDPWMIKFINDMKESNNKFHEWWDNHEIQNESIIKKQVSNSSVGKLIFEMSSFELQNNRDLSIVINTPSKEFMTDKKMKKLMIDYYK